MGYMEGNLSGMDYSYGGGASHYPLWKPPSGYFPRGEAPPPYEEAVAISQAEALSAQCTVSVATTTHRAGGGVINVPAIELTNDMRRTNQQQQQQPPQQSILHQQQQQHPLHLQQQQQHVSNSTQAMQHHVSAMPGTTVAPSQQQQHQQHQQSNQITQSTTNLINININSGGNVTTIATGENHQPPYSLQNDNGNNMLNAVQEHHHHQQLHQQQQLINTNNMGGSGRLHLTPNNSICVQTMTAASHQQQHHHHQQQQLVTTTPMTANPVSGAKIMQQSGQPQQQQQQHNQQQLHQQQQQQPQINCQQALQVTSTECSYKNCHLNVSASVNSGQRQRIQRTTLPTHCSQDMLQQYVTVADVEINAGLVGGYHSLPTSNAIIGAGVGGGGSGDFELIASPTQFANNTTVQSSTHLTGAVSTPSIDMLPQLVSGDGGGSGGGEIATICNTSDSITQTTRGVSGHHTLPTQHSQALKTNNNNCGSIAGGGNGSKTPSSSRRYHRTIPRYFAMTDPLNTAKEVVVVKSASSSSKSQEQRGNTASQSAAGAASVSKKPTCQCPVQHVPMSYMGSNQLSNVQNASNTAFLSALSNKLTSSASSSSSTYSGRSSLSYGQRAKSSSKIPQTTGDVLNVTSGSNTSTIKRSTHNSTTSSPYCNHEQKISTISKQVGDTTTPELGVVVGGAGGVGAAGGGHHHHSHHAHQHHHASALQQHHDDASTPTVLGRVQKKSSSDRARSASSGSGRSGGSSNSTEQSNAVSAAAAAAMYLNGKVDAYLNFPRSQHFHNLQHQHQQQQQQQQTNDTNPVLPPKLHKSLTNLKTTSIIALTTVNNNHKSNESRYSTTLASSTSTASAQTIYTLSKPTATTTTTTRKEHESKNLPPSLTLPPLSPAAGCGGGGIVGVGGGGMGSTNNITSSEKFNKINSSTFYPLQNSHVTYTLPKHISGKVSLNSTIASVVSKVPSVISIPATGGGVGGVSSDSNDNNNIIIDTALNKRENTNTANSGKSLNSANAKSTTLPKILRVKKDATTSSSSSSMTLTNSNILPTTTSSVSHCNMPTYPQQYTSYTSASIAAAATSSQIDIAKHLPVCTTSKNCLNPREHFLPNDTSLDDDYLSECENCKIAQSSKYYLDAETDEAPQETMTLQRKSMDDSKEEQEQAYYRISHTLPTNPKKNAPIKNNNREPWFSTIPASSSSEEDINE